MTQTPLRGMARGATRISRGFPVAAWLCAARSLRAGVLDLLFPAACVSCSAELTSTETAECKVPICPACLDSLELWEGPACGRCSAPLPAVGLVAAPRKGGCVHCAGRKLWFDETIAIGRYAGRLRELVLRMKHRQGQALSLAMGRLIVSRRRPQLESARADVVAPVPMHWRRRWSHGTNSAAVLAEVLASELRLPLAEGLLRRRRHTPPQFSLTPPQRWDNVRRAFAVGAGHYLREARVLLVDDILTTGATSSEAARTLRKAGAKHVTIVVAARTLSG